MPAPTTTGGGLMGSPATVDSGGVTPAIIANDVTGLIAPNANKTFTANGVFLYAFEVYASTVILGGSWYSGATATGNTNMGIYTVAGNLVSGSDSGAIANAASQIVSFTYTTPVTLSPGAYLMACSSSNGTDTYLGIGAPATDKNWRGRRTTNAMSAGALPLTTGTILSNANGFACSLTVQNGLP